MTAIIVDISMVSCLACAWAAPAAASASAYRHPELRAAGESTQEP
ncbi:hypothetical protein ACWDRB_55645 [Nonomuraea sp. NPDC003707]